MGAAVATLVAAAALAWALAATGPGTTVELTPNDQTTRADLTVSGDGAGSALAQHASGLAAGAYTSELDTSPAGSFRVSGGYVDVDLHAAAATRHFVVRRESDGAIVLEADLP